MENFENVAIQLIMHSDFTFSLELDLSTDDSENIEKNISVPISRDMAIEISNKFKLVIL